MYVRDDLAVGTAPTYLMACMHTASMFRNQGKHGAVFATLVHGGLSFFFLHFAVATMALFSSLIICLFQFDFLAGIVFFSRNKSARRVFRLFSAKRTRRLDLGFGLILVMRRIVFSNVIGI